MRSALVTFVALTLAVPPAALAGTPSTPTPVAAASPAAPAESAKPVPMAMPAPHPVRSDAQVTPMGALWRSAIIPGWGQRYKGERSKGWIFTGIAAGLVAGTVGTQFYYQSSRHAYKSLTAADPASTFDSRYRQEVNAAVMFDFSAATTAAFWAYNVSDSAFTPLEHLRIKDARIKDVFPAQYNFYKNNPFAQISVENRSSEPVSKVKLKVEAKDIMDLPAESAVVDTIPPGLGKSLSVTAAFNDRIFDVGQGEPRAIPAKITIEYEVGNKKRKIERTATFTVYNRNAIVWDDMRKLASFVTPRDEAVLRFASEVTRATPKPVSSVKAIARAAALFDAVSAAGMVYQPDPQAPFTYFEGNAEAVDTVSFPRETLQRRTGDCDDLTSLYASLLESTGISTALVDVPGHVYVMFDSELTADEIRRYAPADVSWQMREGTAWIPVEITAINKPFSEAWAQGSNELKKWEGLNKFNAVETEASQQEFPPSPPKFASISGNVAPFDAGKLMALMTQDGRKLSGSEDTARKQALAAIEARHLPPASEANEKGIVFAKDSQFAEAETMFRKAVSIDPRLAKAHNNLANILYLQGKSKDAADEYQKALETGGENAAILANLATLYFEQGDAKNAAAYFERAVRIEPAYETDSDFSQVAQLVHKDASGGAIASNLKASNGVSKAANVGAGEKDPRHSRWIP